MSAPNPRDRNRRDTFNQHDSTVMWAIIFVIAVAALGLLYYSWDSGAQFADTPSRTTQSSTPSNPSSGSGSPSDAPGNQSTTGTTPTR